MISRLKRLETLSLGVALLYILAYIWVATSRLSAPFEIEWMEGGMLAHALRLREGLPIYAPPSLDFVPFFYTPGYPTVLYWLSLIIGELSLPLARGVSLVASLGVMLGISLQVYRETRRLRYAILGAGLFAGLFRTCGAFYDLARPDSLMLLVLIGAVIIGRDMRSLRRASLAALLMACAFFIKQTSAVFFPVILGWSLWKRQWSGVLFGVLTLSLCSVGVMWFNEQTDGAFWSYIFEGHQGHLFLWHNILLEYWRDLLFLAPIMLLLPLLWFSRFSPLRALPIILALHWLVAFAQRIWTLNYPPHMYYRELWYEQPHILIVIPPLLLVILMWMSRQWGRARSPLKTSGYWLWIFIAGVGASGLNHSTQWAYSNCFMLLALAFSLSGPMMLSDLISSEEKSGVEDQLEEQIHESSSNSTRSASAIWGLVLVQLIAWLYSPQAQVPTEDDHRAWSRLTQTLSSHPAPLFFPAHPTYNALERNMRGVHSIHTHQMGVNDVQYRGGVRDLRSRLGASRSAEGTPHWSAVITHERTRLPYLEHGYYEAERLPYLKSTTLKAKTGFLTRPQSVWLPRASTAPRWLHQPNSSRVNANFELSPSESSSQTASHRRPSKLPSIQGLASFVQGKSDEIAWVGLGWRARGDAFGEKPQCHQTHRWRGEGSCGAVSKRRERGELTLDFTLPLHGQVSLLVRGSAAQSRKGSHSRPHLEVRLRSLDDPRKITRRPIRIDRKWRRESLSLPRLKSATRARLSLIDASNIAELSADDIRISVALDAP